MLSSIIGTELTLSAFLICTGVSLVLGITLALVAQFRARSSQSFAVTLALLPMVVQVVIMLVNGNIGAGVAVAGAFSLVRFRSMPGTAREIGALAGRWAAFDRAGNPSPEDGEERLEGLKKAWSTRPMSAFAGVCSNALARFRRRSGPNR